MPNTFKTRWRQNKGFTLIELLVVIAIIGLLASVVLVALNNSRVKGRDAKRVADIRQIASAMELYFSNCNSYPWLPPATTGLLLNSAKALYTGTAAACGDEMGTLPNGGIGAPHAAGAGETILIPSFPASPTPIDDGSLSGTNKCSAANSQLSNSTWNDYVYVSFSPTTYMVYFCISNNVGTLSAGHHTLTETGIQ